MVMSTLISKATINIVTAYFLLIGRRQPHTSTPRPRGTPAKVLRGRGRRATVSRWNQPQAPATPQSRQLRRKVGYTIFYVLITVAYIEQ